MLSFKHWLVEVVLNGVSKGRRMPAGLAGLGKLHGMLPSGHEVHVRNEGNRVVFRVADPRTKETQFYVNSERTGPNELKVDEVSKTSNSPVKLHDVYNYIAHNYGHSIVGYSHSRGARKAWTNFHKRMKTDPDYKHLEMVGRNVHTGKEQPVSDIDHYYRGISGPHTVLVIRSKS